MINFRAFWSHLRYKAKYHWNPRMWIPATILCIRFPFLYPRNRFTGRHYNNWKLEDLKREAHNKAYQLKGEFGNKENPAHFERVSTWWWFMEKFYEGIENFISLFHMIPYRTELDDMDWGWRKAFGIQMCKEMKAALLRAGGRKALHSYRITQIKEKYGELRWYDIWGYEETNKIIEKYAYISRHTCIDCGKPADYITKGWIEPYCKDCLPARIDPEDKEQVYTYYTEELPFYGVYNIKNDKKDGE